MTLDNAENEKLEVRRYLAIVWRWLWLIALAALVAAGAAYMISRRTYPTYEASATLLIEGGQRPAGPNYDTVLMSERLAKTYTILLKAKPVLDEAARRLGGALSSAALDRAARVERVLDTQLVRIKVRDDDPVLAARTANTLCQVFIEQNQQRDAQRVAGSLQRLDDEMRTLQDQIASTQAAIDQERAKVAPDPANLARLDTLMGQYRSNYASILQGYDEARAAEATGLGGVSVIELAQPPKTPVLPRTATNTVLAGLLGAAMAMGVAVFVEYLDDTVKSSEDAERSTQLPILASVIHFRPDAVEPVMVSRPASAPAEAFRLLRTNLQLSTLGLGASAVTVLVTSAAQGEGKTTVVANLGAGLAQIGKRVLLVDCDLRRPTLHKHFGLQNATGLTSLLMAGGANLWQAIQKTAVEGLSVLASGPIPPNPAELLDYPQMAALLKQLRSLADYVIVDSPPAAAVADATILAQKVDGVVLVAHSGRTRTEALRATVTALQGARARPLGVVLNQVAAHRAGYYHYYEYPERPAGAKRLKGRLASLLPVSWLGGQARRVSRHRRHNGADGACPGA